jgi:ariadne-1
MDMDNEFLPVPTKEKKSYEVDYDSLGQPAVEKLIFREVDHICSIFGVDVSYSRVISGHMLTGFPTPSSVQADTARLLLRYLKWNKEKLIEKYMDNASKVLVDAGVTLPETPALPSPIRTTTSTSSQTSNRRSTRSSKILGFSKIKSPTTSPSPANLVPQALKRTPSKKIDESFVCQICFNDEPGLQTLALDCDHAFCKECWNDYLLSKVKDESEHVIRCMAEGCALVAPDQFIRDLLLPAPGSPPGDPEREETNVKASDEVPGVDREALRRVQ